MNARTELPMGIEYEHVEMFFEPGCNHALFDGLEILAEKELCGKYMEK